jgi:AraC-binding-like domain
MLADDEFLKLPELDLDGWRDAFLRQSGRYTPVARESQSFTGRARARNLCGFVGVDLSCNAHRIDRTQQDIRLDEVDHYFALFQVAGTSTIAQNDRAIQLVAGDVALFDSARSATYISESSHAQWSSLQLPRRSLVSHLGFNPQGGVLARRGTAIGRALFGLVRNADSADGSGLRVTHAVGILRSHRCTICSIRSGGRFSSCGQAIQARLRPHQGWLHQSGIRPTRGGRRRGHLAALPSEALHGAQFHLQCFHIFASSGSRCAPSASPEIAENRSTRQRHRLRLRL